MPGSVKCEPGCTCRKHDPEFREVLRQMAAGRTLSTEGRKKVSAAQVKHGMSRTSTYHIWQTMRQRCSNPNATAYASYGGRGITVCDRWQEFENFLADMGERPEGLSLERVNNNGNYEPGNCVWATRKAQAANRRHGCPCCRCFQEEPSP